MKDVKVRLDMRMIVPRLFLVAIFVYLAFVHSHGFIPHDEGVLIQAGNRMMQGEVPYRDFQIVYNPGSIYANWLAFTFFGKNILASRVVAMINSMAMMGIIMWAGKRTGTHKLIIGGIILSYVVWGPGHINFVWPVMFCITFGLLAVTFLWMGAVKTGRWRYWFWAGVASAGVFIFKQNFGLAILLDIAAAMVLVREFRNKTGIFWFGAGYVLVIISQLVYLVITQSLTRYLSDFFFLTMVKIGQEGIFNSPLPWEYPGTVIQKLFKIVLYFTPVIIGVWSFGSAWRKDKKLLVFSGLVMSFYFLGIRPTTDYMHLTPLLAITPIALIGFSKPKKMIYFGVVIFAACGVYSSLYRQYYRWNASLSNQNYFNGMPRVKVWMDSKSRETIKSIDKYFAKFANGNDDLFIYSFSPIYYFVLDRKNPTRYDYLHVGVLSSEVETEVLKKLELKKTGFILADVDIEGDATLIGDYVRDNYFFDKTYGCLTVWRRK